MIENGQRPGSDQFWRVVGRIFDEEEEAAVRRAEFLRLGAVALTGATALPAVVSSVSSNGSSASVARLGSAARPAPNPMAPTPIDPHTRLGLQLFRSIAAGDSRPLAGTQTTHTTDLVIGSYVAKHQASRRLLHRWMTQPATPVLQVNAAGVLAKLDDADTIDEVIESLRSNERARRLYLTAVAARVLRLPWGQAGMLAQAAERPDVIELPDQHRDALLAELANPRDGAARWCALTLLGQNATGSRDLLLHRLQVEQSRETLRALGGALAGQPI
jgi:hypothetical protein